jgi:CCR4-NOT transcription complex subunit 7/8
MSPPPHDESAGGGRTVRVVDVWAHNEAAELARIRGLAWHFNVVAVATSIELPPAPLSRTLDDSYEAVRAAVDRVRSTQLGLVLVSLANGDLPPAGRVWRFHLGEERGEANPRRLFEGLWSYTRACMPSGICVTLDGAADVAYLVRHLNGGLYQCNILFPHLYDLKVLAEWSAVGGMVPPLAAAAAAGGGDAFRRFLELARQWKFGRWPCGYNAFMYGLGAADDQDLLYYKSQKIEHDEDLRRIKEYLLQNNDEEFVTQKLLPVLM